MCRALQLFVASFQMNKNCTNNDDRGIDNNLKTNNGDNNNKNYIEIKVIQYEYCNLNNIGVHMV